MRVIISAYSPKEKCDIDFSDTVSLTKQSFRKESEINNILARYAKTGVIEHANKYEGHYGDFTNVTDYQTSLNAVYRAQEEFMSLPSSIRSEFKNDPAQFLAFVTDENNRDKAIEMGLIPKPIEQKASEPTTESEA